LAQGQELTGRKRRTKTSLQERKKEKTYLTLAGLLMEGVTQPLCRPDNLIKDAQFQIRICLGGSWMAVQEGIALVLGCTLLYKS
jgi:hypothetical protein